MESMEVSSFWENQDLQGFLFPSLSFGLNEGGKQHQDGEEKGKINMIMDDLTNISTSIAVKEKLNEDEHYLLNDEEWMELKVDFSLLDGLDSFVDLLDDPEQVMESEDSTKKSNLLEKDLSTLKSSIGEIPLELAASSVLASPPYSTPTSPEGLVPDVSPPNSPSDSSFLGYHTQLELELMPSTSISAFPVFDQDLNDDQGLNDCLFFLKQTVANGDFTVNSDESSSSQLHLHVLVTEPTDSMVLNEKQVIMESLKKDVVDTSVNSPLSVTTRGRKRKSSSEKETNDVGLTKKPRAKKERKRIQNKDAATRYRQKKRAEAGVVYDQEAILLDENKDLNEKVNQLSTEISYLKGLMREMFKARGLLK